MNLKYIFHLLVLLTVPISKSAIAQAPQTNNAVISYSGVTDSFKPYFESARASLNETLGRVSLHSSMLPVRLKVSFVQGQGSIELECAYDPQLVNGGIPGMHKAMLRQNNDQGFSLHYVDRLMLLLNEYKMRALMASSYNSNLVGLELFVTLNNKTNTARFYCHEYTSRQGIPKYKILPDATITYSGKDYSIHAQNEENLDEYLLWALGDSVALDGTKSADCYAYRFFKVASSVTLPESEEEEVFDCSRDSLITKPTFDRADLVLKYPPIAMESAIQGTTLLEVIVERDGSVSSTEVVRSLSYECDREAMQAVKRLKFNPGTRESPTGPEAIRCRLKMPITFSLK